MINTDRSPYDPADWPSYAGLLSEYNQEACKLARIRDLMARVCRAGLDLQLPPPAQRTSNELRWPIYRGGWVQWLIVNVREDGVGASGLLSLHARTDTRVGIDALLTTVKEELAAYPMP